jgi:hypothetical protein
MTLVNINNTQAINGGVTSILVSRIKESMFTPNTAYFEGDSTSALVSLTQLSDGDAAISELRRAVATIGDFFAVGTITEVAALTNESFWRRLNLVVEAEFVIYTSGHGESDQKVRLLIKTTPEGGE